MKDKTAIKKRILPTLLISSILPLILFLSVPFEVFANNYEEFTFSFVDFFPTAIAFFLLVTIITFFILIFLPRMPYRIISAILISLSFMFFVQGTYLNGTMNTLSGDTMGGEEPVSVWLLVLNTAIWVIVITAGILLAVLLKNKKEGIASTLGLIVSFIVLATQIMSPLSISLTDSKVFMSYADRIKEDGNSSEYKTISNKDLNTVSSGGNIFYFCVDRFDEVFAERAYEEDNTIYNSLTGFTWFQNHMSTYGHTYPAVANMITNNLFNSKVTRKENLKSLYENNNTISILSDNGYKINLYSEAYYAFGNANALPNYVNNAEVVVSSKVTNKAMLMFSILGVGVYRGLPMLAKNFCFVDSAASNHYIDETTISESKKFFCSNDDLDKQFITQTYTKNEGKQFSFIHTDGCHSLNYSKADQSKVTVGKSFDMINKYISKLKEEGLYENSTIIITGDHGNAGSDDSREKTEPSLTALFVKPRGEGSEPLKTSQAQTSHVNLWATIMKSEGIIDINDDSYGKSIFEITEDEIIERTYIWHTWTNSFVEYTYKIVGNAKDFNNWELIKEEHFNRAVMD